MYQGVSWWWRSVIASPLPRAVLPGIQPVMVPEVLQGTGTEYFLRATMCANVCACLER